MSLSLVAGLVATLVACTPPTPVPSSTPTSTPSSTAAATATPEPVALGPEPIIGATCEEILPSATVSAEFGAPVSAANPAISQMTAAPGFVASALTVRALGGLACEWNNGESYSDKRGESAAYVGLRVLVLPDAASQWARYIDYYGADGAGLYCNTSPSGVIGCSANDVVADRWVEITSFGTISEDAAAALHTIVLGAVAAAGPGAAPWTPPADTLPLPENCDGLISYSAVGSAVGMTSPVFGSNDGGGWSLSAGARVNAAVRGCSWLYPDYDAGAGTIRALSAGAWAWNEVRSELTAPSAPEALPIAGLAGSDEAWIRCAPANTECAVDLVIGGNWIALHLWPDDGLGFVTADRRVAATAIAEGVVATLRP